MKKTEKKIMLITLIFVGIILAMLIAPQDAFAVINMRVGETYITGYRKCDYSELGGGKDIFELYVDDSSRCWAITALKRGKTDFYSFGDSNCSLDWVNVYEQIELTIGETYDLGNVGSFADLTETDKGRIKLSTNIFSKNTKITAKTEGTVKLKDLNDNECYEIVVKQPPKEITHCINSYNGKSGVTDIWTKINERPFNDYNGEIYVNFGDEFEIGAHTDVEGLTVKFSIDDEDQKILQLGETSKNEKDNYVKLKALKSGTATLTLTSHGVIKRIKINVQSIKFEQSLITINKNKSLTADVKLLIDPTVDLKGEFTFDQEKITKDGEEVFLVKGNERKNGYELITLEGNRKGEDYLYVTIGNSIACIQVKVQEKCKNLKLKEKYEAILEDGVLKTEDLIEAIDPKYMIDEVRFSCTDKSAESYIKINNTYSSLYDYVTNSISLLKVTEDPITITAKCDDQVSTCLLTIKEIVSIEEEYKINEDVGKDKGKKINTVIRKDGVTITWKSSNTKLLNIDKDGIITTKSLTQNKAEVVTVIAKYKYNGKEYSKSCKVTVKPYCEKITINPSSANIYVGNSETFTITTTPANKKFDFEIDKNYVKLTRKGEKSITLEGLKKTGKSGTKLVVKYGGKTATCIINVKEECESIQISPSNVTLSKGESKTLQAIIVGKGNVTWESSNKDLVEIKGNNNGTATITAKKHGTSQNNTATITAKCGGKSATCKVKVVIGCNKIELNTTSLKIKKGESTYLYAKTDPAGKKVIWSSNSSKVSVDNEGKVTGIKATGVSPVIITAKCDEKTATCKVYVTNLDLDLSIIVLGDRNTKIEVPDGVLTICGTNTTFKLQLQNKGKNVKSTILTPIKWSCKGNGVSITENGRVTINKATRAIISATYLGATESIEVITYDLSSLELLTDNVTIPVGDTYQLGFNRDYSDICDIKWESLKTDIATVDKNGLVTAKKSGTATIKVYCGNQQREATIKVISAITMNPADDDRMQKTDGVYNLEMYTGDIIKIFEKNSYNLYQNLELEYDNTIINITEETGVLKALKSAITTVKVKCGSQTETISVRIKDKDVEKVLLVNEQGYRYKNTANKDRVTNTRSKQYQILIAGGNEYSGLRTVDELNITMIGEYYCAALGTYFGDVGDKFIITLEDRNKNTREIKVIMCDVKGEDAQYKASNGKTFAHDIGHPDYLEFYFEDDSAENQSIKSKMQTKFEGKVIKIYNETSGKVFV